MAVIPVSLVSLAPRNDAATLAARQPGKFLHHALIHRPLERNDQVGKILHRLPAPVDELRLMATAGLATLISESAPVKRTAYISALAAIAAFPGTAGDGARNVIDQPVRDLAELLDRADAGFLIEFALGGDQVSSPGSTPPCGICQT